MSGFLGGIVYGLAGGLVIAIAALFGVWWERKVSGAMQMRLGPTEIGPAGVFQTLADTIKLILKEDITPRQVDKRLFRAAPFLVFTPIAMSLVVIPFATGWAPLNTTVGMLFFLAVPSVSVMGVLIAGFSSGNTYATLGGLRGAAQMISYELPRTLSVLAMALLAGTLAPVEVMDRYELWWTPVTLIAFIVYLISSIAELNRGPFDIPEAESELVAGYFADYSGIRWAIFMMSEYGGIVAAAFFGATIFMGGAHGVPGVLGVLLIIVKAVILITLIIMIKWTFPRFRSDQLLALAWKVLTPMALLQLVIVGVILPWL
mgnify:CR=1 FL=1